MYAVELSPCSSTDRNGRICDMSFNGSKSCDDGTDGVTMGVSVFVVLMSVGSSCSKDRSSSLAT